MGDDVHRELAMEWLDKARHDLASARKLASDPNPIPDTAIYHCQQTAEKAIKALLCSQGIRPRRTHDLRALLADLPTTAKTREQLVEPSETLTPYATAYRYPGEAEEPTREELDEAIRAARYVLETVQESMGC